MSAKQRTSVALVADTHGQLDERVARVVSECDIAVHAGDIGNAAVLDALRPRGGRVLAVRGNNDLPAKWPDADADVLAGLEDEGEIELPGGVLAVVHGHRAGPVADRHNRLRLRYPEAKAIVYGHSHRRCADTEKRPWVLNPGAAGRTRTYGGPTCLVLIAAGRSWSIHEHRFDPIKRR